MKHTEYIKIIKNSDNAVLMVHGIVGTPRHFDALVPLIPEDWSVYNILLDGHGGDVNDFSKTSMKKWRSQVTGRLKSLSENHKNIYIIAHSMGTLLSIEASLKYPEKIRALILLACPLKAQVKHRIVRNSCALIYGKIDQNDPFAVATKNATSVRTDRRLWRYLGWLPRFIELLIFIRQTRKNILSVDMPCFAFQSGDDELVSNKTLKYIAANPKIKISVLEKSGHFYYQDDEFKLIENTLKEIIEK